MTCLREMRTWLPEIISASNPVSQYLSEMLLDSQRNNIYDEDAHRDRFLATLGH